jgi:hypothetical protein
VALNAQSRYGRSSAAPSTTVTTPQHSGFPWTEQGHRPFLDNTNKRTVQGLEPCVASSRTGCSQHKVPGIGLAATSLRSLTGRDRGRCAEVDGWRPWTDHLCGYWVEVRWTRRWKLPGLHRTCSSHCANAASEIAWTIRRTRRDLRTAPRTSAAIARTLPGCCANRCANIPRRCIRSFPATAQTMPGSYLARVGLIRRTLSEPLRGLSSDASQDVSLDTGRMAARTLRGLRPYRHVRGWCLTKMTGFPIPESRKESRSPERFEMVR